MISTQFFGKLSFFRGWSCEIVESSSSYIKLGADETGSVVN